MGKLLSVQMRPTDELNDRTPIRERQRPPDRVRGVQTRVGGAGDCPKRLSSIGTYAKLILTDPGLLPPAGSPHCSRRPLLQGLVYRDPDGLFAQKPLRQRL
jgi:hypothetical protein